MASLSPVRRSHTVRYISYLILRSTDGDGPFFDSRYSYQDVMSFREELALILTQVAQVDIADTDVTTGW